MKARLVNLLFCCLAVTLMSINVLADDNWLMSMDVYCGGYGDGFNLLWEFKDGEKLEISGDGVMKDYSAISPPWNEIKDQIVTIEIHEGVTSIGNGAFRGCSALKTVTIPSSMEIIGQDAFMGCANINRTDYSGTDVQRSAMSVGPGNDSLSLGGNTQSNDTLSDTGSPVRSDGIVQEDINSLSFAFAPSEIGQAEGAPLSAYENLYGGQTLLSKCVYNRIAKLDPGSSYGMAAAAAILHEKGFHIVGQTSQAQGICHDLSILDTTSQVLFEDNSLPISIKNFIEIIQASQGSVSFSRAFEQNSNVDAVWNAVSSYQSKGKECPVICVWRPGQIQALLGYHVEKTDSERKIYVYNPGRPNDSNQYITQKVDSTGAYGNEWEYLVSDEEVWSSEKDDRMTFIPSSVVVSDWNKRNKEPDADMLLLTMNISSATVLDVEDNLVAQFLDGVLQEIGKENGNEQLNVYRTFNWVGTSERPREISVWLPVDNIYSIVSEEGAGVDITVTAVNIQQGVTITTDASTLAISAEDKSVSAFAQVWEENKKYTIEISSEPHLKSENYQLMVDGQTTQGEMLSVSLYQGIAEFYADQDQMNKLIIDGVVKNGSEYVVGNMSSVDTGLHNVRFDDVSESSYYYEAIQWAVSRNITLGTTNSTFSPDEKCTRAHIITFLWRAFGSPESKGYAFEDVFEEAYYSSASKWANEKGLITGNRFNASKPCTRMEAIMYFWVLNGSPKDGNSPFIDVPNESDASYAVAWAMARNITRGKTETLFDPDGICTRGQIATFLYRYFK